MKKLFFITVFTLSTSFSGCTTQESFEGIECEEIHCRDEKQGYYWAKKNKTENVADCTFGFSDAFIRGCHGFIEQQQNIPSPIITTTEKAIDDDMISKQEEQEEQREQWVHVKYRTSGKVNVASSYFTAIQNTDSTVQNAWYDETNTFLLIQLKTTVYQYCNFPPSLWKSLSQNKSPYTFYQSTIKGNFDCREFGEIIYE